MKENTARCESQLIRRLIFVTGLLATLIAAQIVAFGQSGVTPKRGFEPGGSYALSNIETINTTNGNLMLKFPFRLPRGRGGFSAGIDLSYGSKNYDSHLEWYEDESHPPNQFVVQRQMLGGSNQGGWHYGDFGYRLQLIDRLGSYYYGNMPEFPDDHAIYRWKVTMLFPDGSVHEFLPRGFGGQLYQDAYYNVRPDGRRTVWACDGGSPCTATNDEPYLTGTLTYYSFDGTYIRLDVLHDSDDAVWNNPWILYFPDGTRITSGDSTTQARVYDRNNNHVEFRFITYNGNPAFQLVDQLGRDVIVEYGPGTNQDTIHVPKVGGGYLTYQVNWKTLQTFKTYRTEVSGGDGSGYPDILGYLYVVSEIVLPPETGGLRYAFTYNAADAGSNPYPTPSYGWGELSSILLPSGARAEYQYRLDGENQVEWLEVIENAVKQKTLTYQQENDGGSTPVTETWNYNSEIQGVFSSIVAPDGGTTVQSVDGYKRAYKVQQPDGTVVERVWQGNVPQGHPFIFAPDEYGVSEYDAQNVNSFVKTEFTSIRDAGNNLVKTAIKDYNQDKNGNVTSVAEYDWVDYGSVPRDGNGRPTGIPGNAVLKRVTNNSYARGTPDASDTSTNSADMYCNSTSPNLRTAISSSQISGATVLARSEFFYDDPGSTGNLTQQLTWDSTKGGYSNPLSTGNSISISNSYDVWSSGASGKLTQTADARGTPARFTYGSINGFDLYPTQIQTAYGTAVQRTEAREYDFFTGLVTRATDVDNNVSASTTYDIFGRPTLVRAAEGKPEEARTSTEYSDSLRRIIVRSDLNGIGDGKLVAVQHFDQLGRVRLTRQLEDSANQSATDETTGIKVQTRYLYSGSNSYALTSNPYRANTSGEAGGESTMGWTRSKNDNGGRMVEVQTFGGTGLPAPWGGNGTSTGTVTSSYNGNEVTVTDQAGKSRKSVTDALGRLIQVYEDPAGFNYLTSYSYDAMDSLVTVNQGVQVRMFTYDSMKRLSSAANPESGTINYDYDPNGNLLHKIDPRLLADNQTHVTIAYDYDSLNRLTSRSYNDGTPAVTYAYDSTSVANGRGRLVSVSSSVSTYSYSAYDALGRALGGTQTIGSQNYLISYTYDRAGHVLTQTYPSGRTVTNTYDSAGRASSVSGNLGDGADRTYSTGISYASSGQMTQEQFGTATPVYNKLFYNSRGQLALIGVTTVNDGVTWNRGKVGNAYSSLCNGFDPACVGSDNNGNLRRQDVYIPNDDQVSSYTSWPQFYSYDSLNRLRAGGEISPSSCPSSSCFGWQHAYFYDRYGNRTTDAANTWGDVSLSQFAVDTNTNRLGVPSGQAGAMSYDAAGNLTFDSYTGEGSRVYDAENRMTRAWANNRWQIYNYDGDGRRVKRNADGTETCQVYGLGGELLAEYAANTNASNPQKEYGYRNGQLLVTAEPSANVHWLVADQLGTPRMIFDNTGSLAGMTRHDYLNFGSELGAGIGYRTTAMGYSMGDGTRQKFTQKERDNETGLDYFKARYYSSAQGRFTSADTPFADQRPTDPSSWNSYAYVRNNPCSRTDPNGRCSPPPGLKPGQVGICIEAFIAAKTFKTFGAGNNRTFNGNDEKLTSKFRVDIIAERTPGNSKSLNITQKTTPGDSYLVEPLTGVASPAVQGTANSKLNGTQGNSNSPSVSAYDPNGSTLITVPIERNGNASFNVSTKAENGLADFIDLGTIRSSLNLSLNANNGIVKLEDGSQKTGYPSFAIYGYVYEGKNIVTTKIREVPEGRPDALKEPMKPIQ